MGKELEKSKIKICELSTKEALDSFYRQEEDPWHTRSNPEKIIRYKEFEKLLPSGTINSALEIACGEGDFSAKIAKKARKVVGVDISEEVLKRARLKYPGIEFLNADVRELTTEFFLKFDLIVWLDSIYFISYEESQDVLDRISQGVKGHQAFLLFSTRVVSASGTDIENWNNHDFSNTDEFIAHVRNCFPSAKPVPVQLNFNIIYPQILKFTHKSSRLLFKALTKLGGYSMCLRFAKYSIQWKFLFYLIKPFIVHLSMVIDSERNVD